MRLSLEDSRWPGKVCWVECHTPFINHFFPPGHVGGDARGLFSLVFGQPNSPAKPSLPLTTTFLRQEMDGFLAECFEMTGWLRIIEKKHHVTMWVKPCETSRTCVIQPQFSSVFPSDVPKPLETARPACLLPLGESRLRVSQRGTRGKYPWR